MRDPARSAAPPSIPVEYAVRCPIRALDSKANIFKISRSNIPWSRSVDSDMSPSTPQQEKNEAAYCRMSRGKDFIILGDVELQDA